MSEAEFLAERISPLRGIKSERKGLNADSEKKTVHQLKASSIVDLDT